MLRTVQAMGMRGIVVFHAVDRNTPAVLLADEAIEIEGSSPVAAYLDGAQIVAKAVAAGAEAIPATASCPRTRASPARWKRRAWPSSGPRRTPSN